MATRRDLIAGGATFIATGCMAAPGAAVVQSDAAPKIAEVERRAGGRIGVFAINTETLTSIAYRHIERFAMASTFKWILAAAVLKKHEGDSSALDGMRIVFREKDLLDYAPVTRAAIEASTQILAGERVAGLTLAELCAAAVSVSDNTAANLLLSHIGGPSALTSFLRANADRETRLDRREMELNENRPGDPRDTTTPMAMALLAERLLVRDWLPRPAQQKLHGWLIAATPGLNRLRAGLPKDWRAGDKTGTGGNGAHNDVAIAWPPNRRPVVIASYMSESAAPDEDKAAAHADIARIIAKEWG